MRIHKQILPGALFAMLLLNSTHAAVPVVDWIRPTNGSTFAARSPIVLRASASDSDGTLSNLDFVAGTNLIRRFSGPLTNGTYNFVWTNATAGTIQLHAEAMDNEGDRGVSASVQIVVTNTIPTNIVPVVNLTLPTNGAIVTVGTPIFLTANATDADGTISFVDFFAGGLNLGRADGTSSNGLYHWVWTNASAGMYQVRAEAVDNAGARGVSASVQVAVSGLTNAPPSNNVPVVNWIAPSNGAVYAVGTRITLRASASDSDGTLSIVEFLDGPSLLQRFSGALTNGMYTFTWSNAPAGVHLLRAAAVDNVGARVTSASVQIVVSDGASNGVPIVNWIRPTNGAVLTPGTPVLLTASATDADGSVSFVDFYLGSAYLARGVKVPTNSNYTLIWSNPPAGIFQLHAEAVDNAGGRGTSATVQLVVGGASGMVDLGSVEAPTLGHGLYNPNPVGLPQVLPNAVIDFLIDQDQSSGGGGVLRAVSVNWDTNVQFKLTVSAPHGMKIVAQVPAGRVVKFGGYLWWQSTRGGFSAPGSVTAIFTDLEGTAPVFDESESVLSDSHGFFGFVDLDSSGVTNSFSFTSVTLTGTVTPQYTGNGAENYSPHLDSSLYLSYSTTETNDPGSFVSLVPTGPLPMIRLVGASAETGVDLMVYGKAGRTHIVECSPDTVGWTAISSGVMPAAASMRARDASATTGGSRYYRVVEVP